MGAEDTGAPVMAWCEKHKSSYDSSTQVSKILGCPECFCDRFMANIAKPPEKSYIEEHFGETPLVQEAKKIAELPKDYFYCILHGKAPKAGCLGCKDAATKNLSDFVVQGKEFWNQSPALEELKKMTDHTDIDHMIEVLQAYKEGKVIQWAYTEGDDRIWRTCNARHPERFNFNNYKYRIKPETGKDRLIKDLDEALGRPGSIIMVSAEAINALTGRLNRIHYAIKRGDYDDFLGGEDA